MEDFQEMYRELERVRRNTDLPPFHGDPKLDTLTPEAFIERIRQAALAVGWENPRIIREFYLSLRGKAATWYQSLQWDPAFDENNWPFIRDAFLNAYCPAVGALAVTRGFRDLQQNPDEPIRDFAARIGLVMKKGFEDVPDNMIAALVNDDIGAGGKFHAATPILTGQKLLREGANRMKRVFMDTLFRNGIKDTIRQRIAPREILHNFHHNVNIAGQEEAKLHEEQKKGKGTFVSALHELSPDELDELVDRIDAVKYNRKNPPPKKRNDNPKRSPQKAPMKATNDKGEPICYRCHQPGHFRAECTVYGRIHEVEEDEEKGGICEVSAEADTLESSDLPSLFDIFY